MNILKVLQERLRPKVAVPSFPEDKEASYRVEWANARAEREQALPEGLTLHWSWRETLVEPITLSPNGQYVTSGAMDGTVRLWDPGTGDELPERLGEVHSKAVSVITWSWKGLLASGSRDTTIGLWKPETGTLLQTLTGHERAILSLAWSPTESMLASGADDKTVRIWDTRSGTPRHILLGHPYSVRSLAWSPDEQILVSGDDGGQLYLWNTTAGRAISSIIAHNGSVQCLAWSPTNESLFASGGHDATIRLWDIKTGRQIHRLEGHTRQIRGLAFSPDGRILVSQSVSRGAKVCFWSTDTWELLASFPINPFRSHFPLAFHKNPPILLTGGDEGDEIRTWQVDIDALLRDRKPTIQYANARVVLMGDSGVGKTGLFQVLSGNDFQPTISTHARHVSVLHSEEVPLPGQNNRPDENLSRQRREIFLWDLAGQPGYRVIHQLHMSEITLGVVVFDGRNETDPFAGVDYWTRTLRQVYNLTGRTALPLKKLLVAARVDRGGIPVSKERIDEVMRELDFAQYIETSALEGYNIDKLRESIKNAIDWDALLHVTSNELFEKIKTFLIEQKQNGSILVSTTDLYKNLLVSSKIGPDSEELQAQFERCIALVESHDLIKRFRFNTSIILLQPELLDAYASALVNSVRNEPDELGSIIEDKARNGEFPIPTEALIANKTDEKLLLLAMIEDMLRYELAMIEPTSEGNYLVFPSQSMRINHTLPNPGGKTLLFEFEGPIQNIYASLAVRLSRSDLFKKKGLWKDAITFTAQTGGLCGLYLENIGEGCARLTIFFDKETRKETRFDFEDFIEKHLQRRVIPGSIQRFRLFSCPECQEPIPHSAVLKRRELGFNWLNCLVCDTRIDIAVGQQGLNTTMSTRVLAMDASADRQRNLDALRSTHRALIEMAKSAGSAQNLAMYDVFLCYSPGDRAEVQQVSDLLLNRDILPWFDAWQVPSGQNWYQFLNTHKEDIATVAVFIGKDTFLPWDNLQVDQLLRTLAKEHRIIPVLLPEAEQRPQRPDYIKASWLDMRVSEPDPISALVDFIKKH